MKQRHWSSGIRAPIRWARPAATIVLVAVLCIGLLAAAAPASSADPPYLAVTSTTPVVNALDVATGGNITVVFDYAVNGATVSEETFTVDGLLSGPVDGTYSNSTRSKNWRQDTHACRTLVKCGIVWGQQVSGVRAICSAGWKMRL